MRRTVLIGLILLAGASQAARGEIIVLWPDGTGDYPTIQAAIDDACDGDVIYLFPGTYTGPNNIDIDFLGKSIVLQSVAPDFPSIVDATIIDCNGSEAEQHRGFYFHSDEDTNAVLAGLTITNGYASQGGGIYVADWLSSPTIAYCTVRGCFAGYGGGIYCNYSGPVISNCTFTNNSAANYGGGIYCYRNRGAIENCAFSGNSAQFGAGLHVEDTYYQRFTITNCTFTGNSATNGGGGISCVQSAELEIVDSVISHNYATLGGGGLLGWGFDTTLTITNSIISHNSSDEGRGGGIVWNGADLHINGCTISANEAAFDGGGVYFDSVGYSRRCTMKNTTISGNRSRNNGGGILNTDGDLTLAFMNCIVSGNAAFESGGGVHTLEGGRISEMINTTFADNWAQISGGGIYGSCFDNPVTMTNSIIWGNTDNSGTGLLAQLQACGEEADAYVTFSCIQDDNPDDANIPFGADPNFNIDDDPSFVIRGFWADANAPGTPVEPDYPNAVWVEGDYHLRVDSPCIDAGSSDVLPPAKSYSIDIDGQPRVIGLDVDMGADEFGRIVIVNSPQEGDVWVGGSSHQINWYSYQSAGTVDISYSGNNGASWVPIETAVPDTGAYTWLVPTSVDSTQSLVQVVPTIPEPNIIAIDSAPFTIHPDFVHPPVPSQWPSLAGGFDRSSLSDNFGPEVGCVKWQFQTDSPVISSVTAGPGGRIHIACEDGKLYTLDSAGSLVWTFDANSPILCAPTVGPRGSLYVGTEDGMLYAVSIAGTLRWTQRTGGFIWSSPAVSPDGDVYVGSADGRLYALANNGTLLWTFQTNARGDGVEGAIFASPAIAPNGTVYIAGLYDPNLYALDPNDGTIKWVCNFEHTIQVWYDEYSVMQEVNIAGWPFASPVVAADGTIYQGLLFDEEIFAIEPANGTVLWSANFAAPNIEGFDYCYYLRPCQFRDLPPGYFDNVNWTWSQHYWRDYLAKYPSVEAWRGPALGPDGTIYVSLDEDPFLRAVNPDGSLKWIRNVGITGGYTLAVGADGLLYVASDDGHLTVLETDGSEIARFRGAGPLQFPVIAGNDTIIITDANNIVKEIAASGCDGLPAALHRPEDLDGSSIVDNVDFAMLADNWMECAELNVSPYPYWNPVPWPPFYEGLPTYIQGDIDRDLAVTWRDLRLLTDRWLTSD